MNPQTNPGAGIGGITTGASTPSANGAKLQNVLSTSFVQQIIIARAENGWILDIYGRRIVEKLWNDVVETLKKEFGITG